jgi:ABC-type phosphate/phosphonate transport system permease subunit
MAADVPVRLKAPRALTGGSLISLLLVLAAAWSVWFLSRAPGNVRLTSGGFGITAQFFSRAISPAVSYESEVPAGTTPLLWKAVGAAKTTVTFAAAALSLALAGGLLLGFMASSAWWIGDPIQAFSTAARLRRVAGPAVYGGTRVVIAVMRSIHELLWAVLLLAAFGLGHLSAVMAIAIPYAGVLAKVFSEMIDEAPREAALAMRETGATPAQVFLFGLLPRALPDMAAYAFYRFECAIRSSAILGFFGFPTLGYYIAASFDNLLYGEVWTYLYVLFALVAFMDWWSGALRRRFVA